MTASNGYKMRFYLVANRVDRGKEEGAAHVVPLPMSIHSDICR